MSGAEAYFFGFGPSAEAARAVDWARTPLGPVELWSSSLRTTLATIFHSRHPMFLWWGSDLVQFYNDAYLPSFGVGKHPAAMGQRGRACWPEIWHIIGPQIDDVMRRAEPSWNEDQLVPIQRNGRIEEVYWTYGYSPVFGDSGSVEGTLVVCTETTARVIAERRFGLLLPLGDTLLATSKPADTTRLAAIQLESDVLDVPFAIVFSGSEAPLLVGLDEQAAAGIQAITGKRVVAAQSFELTRPVAAGPWPEPVTSVYAIPIGESGHIIIGLSSRLPFDERYEQFLLQIARQIEATQVRVRLENERRNLLEQAPVPAALMTGPTHVFEIANDLYCEMVGRDVRGKAYLEAFPELRDSPLPGILDNVYRSAKPFVTNEMRVPLARGINGALEDCFFKFNLAPILSSDGRVSGMMAVAVDITEQVTARKELQTAARAKDEFLATMSHELRTPLNAMLGWARILKNDARDAAKIQKGLAVIERNAEAQARLVSDLLDVSRIISGKLALTLAVLDVAHVIVAALDVVRSSADAKRVRLECEVALDVGKIVADPDRVLQILWNLLSNAIRFTPSEGLVRISATRAGSRLRIEVADTGEGIRREHLAHIFERFAQVDATTTRQHGGLGLGLAIVRYLVEAHGGSVSALSDGIGKGATFDVVLPIRVVKPSAQAEAPSPTAPSCAAFERSANALHLARVLVVDDDRDSLELLRELLESAGAIVTAANGVEQALAEPGQFDIIISDIGMPSKDGYELIQRIRARDSGSDVPVIALTAYARAEDALRARRAGFQEHLAKPVDPNELLATVKRCIDGWADARSHIGDWSA